MRTTSICLLLLALLTIANARVPSDCIMIEPYPSGISLMGATNASMVAIGNLNEPLGLRSEWEIPNIGHYASWALDETQESNVGLPASLVDFVNTTPELPADVINDTNVSDQAWIDVINDTETYGEGADNVW